MKSRNRSTVTIAVIGSMIVIAILLLGTIFTGQRASKDTERAVRSVSLLYLDELAGRREQVVEGNLQDKISDTQIAVSLMGAEDLSDMEHLQAYQARMKQIYSLEKFAFVDSHGTIYTSSGTQTNISDYSFDYKNLTEPEISILNPSSSEKKVVIAVPVDHLKFENKELVVCFQEIDMQRMLRGVSMGSEDNETTFCNIYTTDGVALTNTVLGGLAVEDNLLDAMAMAVFEDGYTYESMLQTFTSGSRGVVSFSYNGIQETLAYVPVKGTNWQLTYLIHESVISEKISSISSGIIRRSVMQSALTVLALLVMFTFIIIQLRRNARLTLDKEITDAANRAKQEELEQRISLHEKLLEEEQLRRQHDSMITAMASDYRSVYHVDLDKDEAVCYRSDPGDPDQFVAGTSFPYLKAFIDYANRMVAEPFREGFLRFIQPESIRQGLSHEAMLTYRYLAKRGETEFYEMIRAANAQPEQDGDNHRLNAVGIGFTVIDAEMRQSLAQQRALSDALAVAEQANKAKTAFLSNMSHEIRTPMNAIIGLDNIALNDPETPEKTKQYLTKIGESAEHLLLLINDILDMSRIESGRMTLKQEEFSFSKLLESINTMFSSQCADKGLEYHCHINGHVDNRYIGDSMKLKQALINILGNAVKFTPEGGQVTLSVERTAQFEGHSTLRFEIVDTGIGMSAEFLPHIFDTFSQEDASTTSKYGSSGLGMAITKSIIEMMNGTIQVSSEKGKGSTFTVTVTLMNAESQHSGDDGIGVRPEDMSVLIVDDDPVALEHAKLVLGTVGITAETAASGKEALEMVRLRHARMKPYHLILMDWKMPEMDGVETARQIRAMVHTESAIIILTAYKWDDAQEEATAAGVDSFIPKPVFATTVMEEFKSAIQRRKLADSLVSHKAELAGKRVLLAEDMQVNAEIMMMVLQMRQMEAELAVNGKIAVEMFAAHPAGYYSAILMDMRMPEMDGLEATKAIRAMDRPDAQRIPIIALTANAFDEDVQRSLQAGLNAHLSKPVEPNTLFETLESLITD